MQITLKAARINAGILQKDAADMVKVPVSTLCRWENDSRKIPTRPFLELCRIYEVDPYAIFLP